jgi:UTP:GlnB (protein PII) uridylyltransferase
MLARMLESLTQAGARLEFMVARRVTERTSRVFVAPLTGKKQKDAARYLDMVPAAGMHAVRIEGPDRVGLGAEIARTVAASGVNIRGASAATIGRKSVFYLAFRTDDELKTAIRTVRRLLSTKSRKR